MNNKVLLFIIAISTFYGCEEDRTGEIGHVNVTPSQMAEFIQSIDKAANEFGMRRVDVDGPSEIKKRRVVFINFHLDGRVPFTIHDLAGAGKIEFYIEKNAFMNDADYLRFRAILIERMEKYSDVCIERAGADDDIGEDSNSCQ